MFEVEDDESEDGAVSGNFTESNYDNVIELLNQADLTHEEYESGGTSVIELDNGICFVFDENNSLRDITKGKKKAKG